jgi:transcriptional regulator with XRE-family HTH domain
MAKDEDKLFKLMGKRIRDLRIKAGFKSQEAFAYEANIPRAQYGRYESGSNITMKNLLKIVQFHKMTFEEFFSQGFEKIK